MAALGAHADKESSRDDISREALALLERALECVDRSGLTPEIGARLQDVIDILRAKVS